MRQPFPAQEESETKPSEIPLAELVFIYERVDVATDEGWGEVQRRGLEGWELVSVDQGIAYLRHIVVEAALPEERPPLLCSSCQHYKAINQKLGKCTKHLGRMTCRTHVACVDHPDHPEARDEQQDQEGS